MSVCGDLEREAAPFATCGTGSVSAVRCSRGAWAASGSAARPAALPARSARVARSAPLLAPSPRPRCPEQPAGRARRSCAELSGALGARRAVALGSERCQLRGKDGLLLER